MASGDKGNERGGAPAVTRAIAVLDLLATSVGTPMTLTEIARSLGLAKSSTSNLCNSLEAGGLVQRHESGYTLGRRTLELGGAFLHTFDQVREFYKICTDSPVLGKELLQLTVRDGADVLYLARHEGHGPLRLSASIGDRFPAALTAVGNALLSTLSVHEVEALFPYGPNWPRMTERSVSTVDALQIKLAAARERGYALDDGETFVSVVGIAMPVPPRSSGEPAMAIGASIMRAYDSEEHRARVISAMREAVAQLSNPMVVLGSEER